MTSKAANAHATLSVPCKCVLSCKATAARALIGLVASVDFCMALKIVLAHKALAASSALKLSVAKMCLNVRADIFPPNKDLAAILVQTCPLVCLSILLADVALDLFGGDTAVLEAGIDFEVSQGLICRDSAVMLPRHKLPVRAPHVFCRAFLYMPGDVVSSFFPRGQAQPTETTFQVVLIELRVRAEPGFSDTGWYR
jgi:hypothetical protein